MLRVSWPSLEEMTVVRKTHLPIVVRVMTHSPADGGQRQPPLRKPNLRYRAERRAVLHRAQRLIGSPLF